MQLKQSSSRLRSSISVWDSRFTGLPSTDTCAGVGAVGGTVAGTVSGEDAPLACAQRSGRGRGWHRALITQLQLASKAHGGGEGVRVVYFHVEAEGRLQSRREDLCFLDLRERAWYSTTDPVRLHAMSSPRGLERRGGPKRR